MKNDKKLDSLIQTLCTKTLNKFDFIKLSSQISCLDCIDTTNLCDWKFLGLELIEKNGKISMLSSKTKLNDQVFCIVDIETNGDINSGGQIIEIGALKVKEKKVIDTFHSLVYADFVPQFVSEITNIKVQDLKNAPKIKEVLENFRLFLGSAVFVAHNVKFDYDFISKSLEKWEIGILLNRKLCTIDLAKRTIKSQKYGLKTLKEILNINCVHHRALDDAICAKEIFLKALNLIPENIKTTEQLIAFSKSNFKGNL